MMIGIASATTIIIMTEQVVVQCLGELDRSVWTEVADRAISKMPKYKLAVEAQKMFNDFTLMNSVVRPESGEIKEEQDMLESINENLLVGTSKMVPDNRRPPMVEPVEEMPKVQINRRVKPRSVSTNAVEERKANLPPQNNNFFRLTFTERSNAEEERTDDILRTTKYENIKYNQQIERENRERVAASEQRAVTEKKRFREMKTYTYDYEGKVMPLGARKSMNVKVINMKPEYSAGVKLQGTLAQRLQEAAKMTEILNKKIVGQEKPSAKDIMKEKDKEKDAKLNKYLNSNTNRPKNGFELFKEDTVSIGVSITDAVSQSKFKGKIRDKGERKNLQLNEFKDKVRQVDSFKPRVSMQKFRISDEFHGRTQPSESVYERDRMRIRTQGTQLTDKSQKILSSLTRYVQNRGKIVVKNSKLYSENFTEDVE